MIQQDFREFSALCGSVLMFPETGFARGKEFISQFFKSPVDKMQTETIRRRLIIIDALYSTNMSRRLYGIDELADEISQFSDKECIEKCKVVLQGRRDEWLYKVFERKYGKTKSNAKPAARCFSLISKYAHYLCDFEFPIYDSLVKYYFNDLLREIIDNPERSSLMPQYQEVSPEKFLSCLLHLKEVTNLSFEQIDNVLWTYGKLQDRSLSLIVTSHEYENLIKEDWFKKKDRYLSFNEAKDILVRIKGNRARRRHR